MAAKEKEKWHTKWWATGVLLPFIASGTYDLITQKPLLTSFIIAAKWLYSSILSILNFEVKVWYILAFIVVAFVAIILIDRIISKPKNPSNAVAELEPTWINYKRDIFKRWLWSWQYEENHLGQFEIVNLIPICQKCDIKMLEDNYTLSYYRCPNCNNYLSANTFYQGWENKQDIEALILNKIEKGTYPNASKNALSHQV